MKADPTSTSHPLRFLAAAAPLLIFVLALVGLHKLAGEFRLDDVRAAFRHIPRSAFAFAALFAAISYFLLTQYERIAVRHVGSDLPYPRIALTSFISYAVGHNVGMSALSGGAIRFRLYSAMGLSASQIAQVIGVGSMTFALGATALAGVSLIGDAGLAASLLHANRSVAISAGFVLLAVVSAYWITTAVRKRPISFRDWQVSLPSPGTTGIQIALSAADLLCACATLYVLLPDAANVTFWAFAGLFMVALAAGVVSAVPGGLGVFEAVFVLLLPGVAPQQLLGVLIAYRLIYYVAPFLIAVTLLLAHEIWGQRHLFSGFAGLLRQPLGLVAPQVSAFLCFGAGMVLLISGTTPAEGTRLASLQQLLPLPILELSHLAGSAIGTALLILAWGLYRRLDGAWFLALWLLGAGIVASVLKGLDWEEACVLAAVAVTLLVSRREFHRHASLLSEPLSPAWIASACMALGATVAIGLLAYRRVTYSHELWWQFAFDANAPRMLRGVLSIAVVLGGFGLLRLLSPNRARPVPSASIEEPELLALVRKSSDGYANLALLGDKSILLSESRRSFIMYAASGHTWVAMGDPVGPVAEWTDLIWKFREQADQHGCVPAFYEISPEQLPEYIDAGFGLSKLGEEARVALDDFSLEGSARAALRQSHSRGQRDGLSFRVAPPDEFTQMLPRLQQISDEWLADRNVGEKGFSLGFFDAQYLQHFPMAVASHQGQIVAFANIWETHPADANQRTELSVDLMRHSSAAPRSVMDYLFIELMLWGKSNDYAWFNFGMAPLAGLEVHRLAPAWHKIGRLVYRLGSDFYNFDGLRAYKDKFDPEWRPRYLAAPGRFALARVMLDVTTLISGGVRQTLFKTARR
ncbi:MAG: bifunctional lysylphosphatidylglycerol flippase/synthetase MprF [Pseudomonadota bacterium]